MLIERLIVALAAARKRWWLGLVPVLASLLLAGIAAKASSTKYVTSAIILFQPANRVTGWAGSGDTPRQNAVEQLGALEAWLKSDHVLLELLPKLRNDSKPVDPVVDAVQMAILRKSLTLELTGNSALVMRLEGPERDGLGRKLEIIIARLMEGLIRPDADILSASQLIALRRSDALNEAEAALSRALKRAGIADSQAVLDRLEQVHNARRKREQRAELTTGARRSDVTHRSAEVIDDTSMKTIREQISADAGVVASLEELYANAVAARADYDIAARDLSPRETNYVGIFDSPEKLKVIGRPRDPHVGERVGAKIAVVILFLGVVGGAGLIFLSVMLGNRVYFAHEFAALTGLPVLARLPRLTQPEARLGTSKAR